MAILLHSALSLYNLKHLANESAECNTLANQAITAVAAVATHVTE